MLLIDAYNVLHQSGHAGSDYADIELPELVALLDSSRYAGRAALLVCDGVRPGIGHTAPSVTRIGQARVLYTGAGRDADSEIEAIIAQSAAPRRLLVVSSDKRLRRAARRRRAPSLTSESFMVHLRDDADRSRTEPLPKWVHEIPLDANAVAAWIRRFGLDTPDTDPRAADQPSDLRADERSVANDPTTTTPPDTGSGSTPATPAQEPTGSGDPELDELLDRHAPGIDPGELDMSRWLGDRAPDR